MKASSLSAGISGNNRIKADVHNVRDTTLATTLGLNGVTVSTVEHLMSAFSGMGVDNAMVEVDAPEVPIMDGSARPFVDLLKDVGTRVQGKGKKIWSSKTRLPFPKGRERRCCCPPRNSGSPTRSNLTTLPSAFSHIR